MGSSVDLLNLFNTLELPALTTEKARFFSVISIPENGIVKIGKDIDNFPCILIRAIFDSASNFIAPIVLENLSIEFDLECLVHQQNGVVETGRFTVVICRQKDSFILRYFFQVMVSIIDLIGENPTDLNIQTALNIIVELFRGLSEPPRKSAQGLWSELLIISKSNSPKILLDAWHATPEDRYDFCQGNMRIEVKSSSQRVRRHHFSLEQLTPPPNSLLLIASMFVERAGGGISISDLANQIREKIVDDPIYILNMDRIISETLGDGLKNGLSERFDYELAKSSIAFFDYDVIPSIDSKLPLGVSNVQFVSDLSGKPAANIQKIRLLGGIFEAAL